MFATTSLLERAETCATASLPERGLEFPGSSLGRDFCHAHLHMQGHGHDPSPALAHGPRRSCRAAGALRVLAPNPSPYTFTGTQTYVVGPADGPDCAVIDPGPNDPAHIEAIIAAMAGRKVLAIMCTHTHRDHSPAAAPLAKRTGAPIVGCAPLVLATDLPRFGRKLRHDLFA